MVETTGMVRVKGRIQGYVSGEIDGEFDGILKGDVHASVSGGSKNLTEGGEDNENA